MTHPRPNNRQRGELLEDTLRWQHNIYANQGRALILQPGVKSAVRRGRVIQMRSLPDFIGALTGFGGRTVMFDAKLTASMRYSHPSDRLHQLKTLYDVEQAGGIAFLLVSHELERFFMLWPQLSWRDERAYSVRLDKLTESQGVEFDRGGSHRLPDWLSAIEDIYRADGKLPSDRAA